MIAYGVLTAGWVAYFLLHSLLAEERVKKWASRWLSPRSYRRLYNIVAAAGLLAMLVITASIPAPVFFGSTGLIRYLSLLLTTCGVMLIHVSFRSYSIRSFLGLATDGTSPLKTEGVLRYIRHPLYAGIILITVGLVLFVPNLPTLIACGSVWLYVPVGIRLEERKLVRHFGDAYRAYRKSVPALVPRPW